MRRGIIFLAALLAALIVALPASAEKPAGSGARVVQSSSGGITITQLFINDELRSTTTEIRFAGGLFQSTLRLSPDGSIRSQETRFVSGSFEQITVQEFSRNGTLRREIVQQKENDVVTSETMTIFDRQGDVLVTRTRAGGRPLMQRPAVPPGLEKRADTDSSSTPAASGSHRPDPRGRGRGLDR